MSTNPAPKTKRVWIVVLGDIGRSPRMQNHVKSFAENGHLVEIIGYHESRVNQEIASDPRVTINRMTPFPEIQLPRVAKYIFKIFWTILSLLGAFFSVKKADMLMLQNPPGIPALALCYFYCKVVQAKYIIDWHNYTWSIMALETSPSSFMVKYAKIIEFYFGRKSDLNFCVTEAMRENLHDRYDIEATVLYDRPTDKFQTISLDKKHELFQRLGKVYPDFRSSNGYDEVTAFTTKNENGEVKLRDDRPGLIVSSTSWTPDEDFEILLKALIYYDKTATNDDVKYPKLICVITGKGPQKAMYQQKIAEQNLKCVKIITPWLENEDYPLMLASADLGVSLHFSSSGYDLPMKIVDMFGCGLPVCSINFKCLHELVIDGKNGFVFNNEDDLGNQLTNWFYGYPGNVVIQAMKDKFAKNLRKFQMLRWKENWNNVVLRRL